MFQSCFQMKSYLKASKQVFKAVFVLFKGIHGCVWWILIPDLMAKLIFRHCIGIAVLLFLFKGKSLVRRLYTRIEDIVQFNRFFSAKSEQLGHLRLCMEKARSFTEWRFYAQQVEALVGVDQWKYDSDSPYYDHKRIDRAVHKLHELMASEDVAGIVKYIRGSLLRNYAGIANSELHDQLFTGTKIAIEHYIETVVDALKMVQESSSLSNSEKYHFFSETRHAFGRSALLLSGGGNFGMFHAGVLKALFDLLLLPKVISGASAGSFHAAWIGVRSDVQIQKDLADLIQNPEANSTVFFESKPGLDLLVKGIRRVMQGEYFFSEEALKRGIISEIGHETFAEAYERTGRIINIVIGPASTLAEKKEIPRILNYLTSPDVLIWSAVMASCAIPGLFRPVELMRKTRSNVEVPYYSEVVQWSDGSFFIDLPMERLSQLFNINHFIVSQVNPHIVIFSAPEEEKSWMGNLCSFLFAEVKGIVIGILHSFGNSLSISRQIQRIISQKSIGDINIVAPVRLRDLIYVVGIVEPRHALQWMFRSETKTFEKVAAIKHHCEIEFALDDCVKEIRSRLTAAQDPLIVTEEETLSQIISRTRSWSSEELPITSSIQRD